MVKRFRSRSRPVMRKRPRRMIRARTVARSSITRRSALIRNPVHKFSRYVNYIGGASVSTGSYNGVGLWTVPTAIQEASMSLNFSLSDLPSVNDFTTLYDQYQLRMAVVTIKMLNVPEATNGVNSITATYSNFYPTLWYVQDHDDSATANVSQLKEFARVKHVVLRPNKEIRIPIKLSTLQAIYNTYSATTSVATFTRGVVFKPTWMDMSDAVVPHYGLKMAVDFEGLTTGAGFAFKVDCKYYFRCKNPR